MYDVITMKSIAQQLNDRTYTDYYYRLMLLSRSVFEWSGLPNHIDEKWIERYLFSEGKCVFFKDENKGFMIAKPAPFGDLNHYDEPTLIRPYNTNYDGEELTNGADCVLIRNNDAMIPTAPTIQLYALRLAEISRTIDININAQKTPLVILCSEKQKNTMKHVFKQWNGFEPVIYGDKNLDINSIDVLKTDAPIVFDKLQIQKHAIWNECMTFLGINNANMDKRERLVDDEVQANNEQVGMSAEVMLKAREQACVDINRIFGTNISVKLRSSEKHSEEHREEGVAV